MIEEEQIPELIKCETQWVCWRAEARNGNPTKVPLDPSTGDYAKVDQPETWDVFDTAVQSSRKSDVVDGVGFVFREDGGYAGVDLDDARDPDSGTIDEWAVELISRLDTYTERSPSGTGFHLYMIGNLPKSRNRKGDIEMYDRGRFFTVTGAHVAGTPTTVEDRAEALRAIHAEYIAGSEPEAATGSADRSDVPLSDRKLVERAMNAENGEKFRQLWTGDTSGYPSHSEADLAFCGLLAFWTGGDRDRIERLFGKSGLTREKWWNRADYREMTIETALDGQTESYDPAPASPAGEREESSS